MLSTLVLAGSFLAAVANAQTIETSSAASVAAATTASQVMPPAATQAFNPAPIDPNEAFSWCIAQRNNCPIICGGSASTNTCNSETFTYSCVCSNGTVPDVTVYVQTLPFFMCQATYGQCVDAHPNDAIGQAQCEENAQCGTRNATAEALATSSASSTGTATATTASESASGSATAAESSPAPSETGAAVGISHQLSTGIFAAVLMGAFKLLL